MMLSLLTTLSLPAKLIDKVIVVIIIWVVAINGTYENHTINNFYYLSPYLAYCIARFCFISRLELDQNLVDESRWTDLRSRFGDAGLKLLFSVFPFVLIVIALLGGLVMFVKSDTEHIAGFVGSLIVGLIMLPDAILVRKIVRRLDSEAHRKS